MTLAQQAEALVAQYDDTAERTRKEHPTMGNAWDSGAVEILRKIAESGIVSIEASRVFVDPAQLPGGFAEVSE